MDSELGSPVSNMEFNQQNTSRSKFGLLETTSIYIVAFASYHGFFQWHALAILGIGEARSTSSHSHVGGLEFGKDHKVDWETTDIVSIPSFYGRHLDLLSLEGSKNHEVDYLNLSANSSLASSRLHRSLQPQTDKCPKQPTGAYQK